MRKPPFENVMRLQSLRREVQAAHRALHVVAAEAARRHALTSEDRQSLLATYKMADAKRVASRGDATLALAAIARQRAIIEGWLSSPDSAPEIGSDILAKATTEIALEQVASLSESLMHDVDVIAHEAAAAAPTTEATAQVHELERAGPSTVVAPRNTESRAGKPMLDVHALLAAGPVPASQSSSFHSLFLSVQPTKGARLNSVAQARSQASELGGTTVAPQKPAKTNSRGDASSHALRLSGEARARDGAPPTPTCGASNPESVAQLIGQAVDLETEATSRERRYNVARLINGGQSASNALRSLGLDATDTARRQALRLAKALREDRSIEDQRPGNSGATRSVRSPEMTEAIRAYWCKYPEANTSGLRLALTKHVRTIEDRMLRGESTPGDLLLAGQVADGTLRIPSASSMRRAIQEFGPFAAALRKDGKEEVMRQKRPVMAPDWATRVNEEWETDHQELKLRVRVKEDGVWREARVWLSANIDQYSRAIAAFIVTTRHADSMLTAALLRESIRRKPGKGDGVEPQGVPERLRMDNGSDYRSEQLERFCIMTGIQTVYCEPFSPDQKPHIEAFFSTVHSELVPMLPGGAGGEDHGTKWNDERISRLLTIDQLREIVGQWIHEVYHRRVHSVTLQRPIERWRVSAQTKRVPSDRELDTLLLYTASRMVARGFVRLTLAGGPRGIFWAPCLTRLNGESLTIRYNPDDQLSVLAYDEENTKFIGEIWNLQHTASPYSRRSAVDAFRAHVKSTLADQKFLAERLVKFHHQIQETDRQSKREVIKQRFATDVVSQEQVHRQAEAKAAAESLTEQARTERDMLAAGARARLAAQYAPPSQAATEGQPRADAGTSGSTDPAAELAAGIAATRAALSA